jgi:chromosome segregation ATPase
MTETITIQSIVVLDTKMDNMEGAQNMVDDATTEQRLALEECLGERESLINRIEELKAEKRELQDKIAKLRESREPL